MGSENAVLDALIAHSLAEFKDDTITKLGQRAFYKNDTLTSIELPNVTTVNTNTFEGCTALTTASFASLTSIVSYMFQGCSSLKTVTAPNATRLEQQCFADCTALEMTSFPNITYIGYYAFKNAPAGVISFPACTSIGIYTAAGNGPAGFDFTNKLTIPANAFNGSSNFSHLVLRSNELCPLSDVNAFAGTPISVKLGYIYVPADLVDTYKAATNWSTFADQILPLTAYPATVSGSISDTWAEIFEAEQNGTYRTKYSVGDTKIVDIDGTGVLMQIVAMDSDVLTSDSSKTAPITWISAGLIENRAMNAGNTTSGGWADSAMRTYMRETLFPKIESTVRLNIKEVNKTYKSYTPTNGVLTAADTVWIPSCHEIFGDTTLENSGPIYSSIFNSTASRIKNGGAYGLGTAGYWWLRSAGNGANFYSIHTNGERYPHGALGVYGLALGFCT